MAKSSFQGKFVYYENINGKSKKVEKTFTDAKKFNEFTKKYPIPRFEMPRFDLDFGLVNNMKSLFNEFVDKNFPMLFGVDASKKTPVLKTVKSVKKTKKLSDKKTSKKKK